MDPPTKPLDVGLLERQMRLVPCVLVVNGNFPREEQPLLLGAVGIRLAIVHFHHVSLVEIHQLLVVIKKETSKEAKQESC